MSCYENLSLEETLKLQKLDAKMLWHNNYWDGPLSGVCQVGEDLFWFDILIETDPAIPCPKEEECDARIEAEIAEYKGDIVSASTDDEDGVRDVGAVNKQEDWRDFFEQAKEWPVLNHKQELLGYFTR